MFVAVDGCCFVLLPLMQMFIAVNGRCLWPLMVAVFGCWLHLFMAVDGRCLWLLMVAVCGC